MVPIVDPQEMPRKVCAKLLKQGHWLSLSLVPSSGSNSGLARDLSYHEAMDRDYTWEVHPEQRFSTCGLRPFWGAGWCHTSDIHIKVAKSQLRSSDKNNFAVGGRHDERY